MCNVYQEKKHFIFLLNNSLILSECIFDYVVVSIVVACYLVGYGANLERLEILQEYLKSGTWDRDTSWSEEASKLQNIAVNTPHLLTGDKGKQYILDFFRNLRMVDKEVRNFFLIS